MKLLIFKQAILLEKIKGQKKFSPTVSKESSPPGISVKVCGSKILVISFSERPRLSVLGLEAAVSSSLKRNAFYTDSYDERTIHNM